MEPTGPRCSECRRAGIFATQGDGHSRLNEVKKETALQRLNSIFAETLKGRRLEMPAAWLVVEMTGVVDPLPCVAEIRQWLAMSKYGGM